MNDETDNGSNPAQESDIQSNVNENPIQRDTETDDQLQEAQAEGEQKPDGDGSDKKRNRPEKSVRDNYRLQQENAYLKAQLEAKGNGQQPAQDDEPKLEDFADATDWVLAQTKWEARQAVNAYKAEQAQAAEQQQLQRLIETHEEREEEFAETVPDYEEKVVAIRQSGLITPDIQKAVLQSDMSEKIAYHLANYPDDARILYGLNGNKAALKQAINQIETFIQTNPVTPAVKQTRAAAPINPVNGKSAVSSKDPKDMSQAEIEAWRYGKPQIKS